MIRKQAKGHFETFQICFISGIKCTPFLKTCRFINAMICKCRNFLQMSMAKFSASNHSHCMLMGAHTSCDPSVKKEEQSSHYVWALINGFILFMLGKRQDGRTQRGNHWVFVSKLHGSGSSEFKISASLLPHHHRKLQQVEFIVRNNRLLWNFAEELRDLKFVSAEFFLSSI